MSILFLKEFIELNINLDTLIKMWEVCGIKYKYCDCFLECTNFKDVLIEYKCLYCNRNYHHKLDEKSKNDFWTNRNNSKFILLLGIDVYNYEYIDDGEKFSEISLPEKENLYSDLNMEDITDADYMHSKRVCEDFKIKNLGEYYDLYVQGDALMLVDVFKKLRNMCIEIYELEPTSFFRLHD